MAELSSMLGQLAWLFFIDGVFLALLFVVVVLPLALTRKAAYAVLKRNFVGYFSNPTGYVFLCVFVMLTSGFAFLVDSFFSTNLANLDQLNSIIPWIMVLFISTITMSIWADERRQGTDELLLTLPADDFDIVAGKYLAAAAIFTVSLLFSQLSSYAVLVSLTLGNLDSGLLFTTYLGYWFMGLAMLSLGMVASFLTSNLTVGFILGALFNIPLVVAKQADSLVAHSSLSQWSMASQFDDFGRGVISLASSSFFILTAFLGVYLSIVLIGRRHWFNSSEGQSWWRVLGYVLVSLITGFGVLAYLIYAWSDSTAPGLNDIFSRIVVAGVWAILIGLTVGLTSVSLVSVIVGFFKPEWIRRNMFDQYVVRAMSLAALVFGLTYFLSNYDYARLDMTRGQVSSLSPQTKKLVANLENEYPIVIEAYLSAEMPDRYAKTKYDLLSILKEFKSLAGTGIQVNIYDNLERASEEARAAEDQYGISARPVTLLSRGALREEQVMLGIGMRCGLEKVSVPFLDYGVPVEYELVRSLTTVAKGEREHRKKVWVVSTDAQIMGGFTGGGFPMSMPQQIPEQAIIAELKKQYKVDALDVTEPVDIEKFKEGDVMLAVQPSSLNPQQMANFVAAVKLGIPTAIFEDPLPAVMRQVVGTGDPKRGGMQQQPQPKGDIRTLWKAIGAAALGDLGKVGDPQVDLVWQKYNPYPKLDLRNIGPELVFIRNEEPRDPEDPKPAFNPENDVVKSVDEILFPYPGGVVREPDVEGITFIELVRTGDLAAGRIPVREYMENQADPNKDLRQARASGKHYVIAAELIGKKAAQADSTEEKKTETGDKDDNKKDKDDKSKAKKSRAIEGPRPLHVVYVADIDCLDRQFVEMRANPTNELFGGITFNFENVSFVLNVIDRLAGDERFLNIRTRKFSHPTLRAVELKTEQARSEMDDAIIKFTKKFEEESTKIDKERDDQIKKLQDEIVNLQKKAEKGEPLDYQRLRGLEDQFVIERERLNKKAERTKRDLEQGLNRERNQIELANEKEIQQIQNWFKAWALLLPPIPPLLLGLVVFARRRVREREGISKARMR